MIHFNFSLIGGSGNDSEFQSFVFLFSHQSATCLVNTNLIDSIIEGPEYFIGSNMSWPNYCSPNADRKDTY